MSSIKALAIAKATGGSGGGGEITLETLNVDANATYNAPSGKAYKKVNVNVPNSYVAGDEGKVVSGGALVAQTAHADVTPTTSDQTIDTTSNNSIKVKGDADLVAGNIKKDVEIFGVTGTYEGGGGGSSLPADYQEVEYLEFYGAQYIAETGINLAAGDVILTGVSRASGVQSSEELGVLGGNAPDTFELYFYQSTLKYYGNIDGSTITGISANTKYPVSGRMKASATDLSLGRYHADYWHKGRIWEAAVVRFGGDRLLRRYVPCYRKSDNEAGFYELIQGIFYTNLGTGTIGVGPDVT